MISLHDFRNGTWEQVRGNLQADLQRFISTFNTRWATVFTDANKLQLDSSVDNFLAPTHGGQGQMQALLDQASIPLDASLGCTFYIGATGNRTLQAPSNPTAGQIITIAHKAIGGARTLTLTTGNIRGFRFGATVAGLSATTSGKTDYIQAVFNDIDTYWDVILYAKTY